MARKLTREQIEAEKLRLAEDIRDEYALGVPAPKHNVDVTVTRDYRHGSSTVLYLAKVDAPGWDDDTATGDTELRALRKLHRKLL